MHPVNMVLSLLGLKLVWVDPPIAPIDHIEKEFREKYELGFKQAKRNQRGLEVYRTYRFATGEHPKNQQDLEFEFSAYHLYKAKPLKILDIGTYRHF